MGGPASGHECHMQLSGVFSFCRAGGTRLNLPVILQMLRVLMLLVSILLGCIGLALRISAFSLEGAFPFYFGKSIPRYLPILFFGLELM